MAGGDLLICGSCQRSFPLENIVSFMEHKKFDCDDNGNDEDLNKILLCQACHQKFQTPWSLLKHAQKVHSLRIYLEQTYNAKSVVMQEEMMGEVGLLSNISHSSMKMETFDKHEKSNFEIMRKSAVTEPEAILQSSLILADKVNDIDKATSIREEHINDDNSSNDEQQDDQLCCDDQDCGITVMPGTHESLKKCCSAVVPKKRKRHMEIKHKILRNNALARLRRQKAKSTQPANIYIDLAPHSGPASTNKEEGSTSIVPRIHAGNSISPRLHPSVRQRSVIIQPGTTFSIPVSGAGGSIPSYIKIIGPDFQRTISTSDAQIMNQQMIVPLLSSLANNQLHGLNPIPQDGQLLPKISEQVASGHKSKIPNTISMEMVSGEASDQSSTSDNALQIDMANQNTSFEESQLSEQEQGHSGKKRRYPTSRPYKCDQCTDAFNQRIHLRKHQSKHTGIKPFKCDHCDYATVERSHLKVHIRVHTGEKPFKCTYCEYATSQKSTLKIHLKRHHTSTSEHCYQCSHKEHKLSVSTSDAGTEIPPDGANVEK